jgi:endo-1,4-beta-xylanase
MPKTKIQMSKITIIITLISIILPLTLMSQPTPSGRRLKEIVAEKYPEGNLLVGATTGAWALGTPTGIIMNKEFSYVTPENDFKQDIIHPDNSGTWNWEAADKWAKHVAETGQILRIHGPIGPQCSQWAQEDDRTAKELEKNLKDFMKALCIRYNGKKCIEYLDVVNETVSTEGLWFYSKPGYGWENPWPKIGYDNDKNRTPLYIKYAFEIATKYAPDMKLIYNQHADYLFELDWNLIKETVFYLREQGLRVDGIGCQAHFNAGWENISGQLKDLENLVDWAHQNNLEFHITEFSVWMRDGMSSKELEKQAATYKAVMEIMIAKSMNGLIGWNTWHIDDSSGWRNHLYPSLFDTNYVAKPAYYAVQEALNQK